MPIVDHLKTRHKIRICALLLLGCLMLPLTTTAATLSGRVIAVPDANVILILTEDGRRLPVALVGLASPPAVNKDWRKIGKRHLQMLLAGRTVTVDFKTRSKQGVILGEVLHGGADVGLRLLRSGLAVIDAKSPPPANLQSQYLKAAEEARRRRMGFWQTIR